MGNERWFGGSDALHQVVTNQTTVVGDDELTTPVSSVSSNLHSTWKTSLEHNIQIAHKRLLTKSARNNNTSNHNYFEVFLLLIVLLLEYSMTPADCCAVPG